MTVHPVGGIALVIGALVLLMTALRFWQRIGNPHPEFVRKALHIGMGLVGCTLPWIFRSPAPVVALCAIALLIMVSARVVPMLRRGLGEVVCGVGRDSLGDIYFPMAIGVTFVAAKGSVVLYLVPVLVLTLADAMGALIGMQFGAHRYRATEGRKSLEGSLAFFVVAFGSVLVPLWVDGVNGLHAVLISATVGMLVMALEAVAWRGLDNLFVPLGTFVLLQAYLALDTGALVVRLMMTAGLFALVLAIRRQTTLNESALLGAAFAGYVFGAVGGWTWLVAPVTLLMSYTMVLSPRTRQNIARIHTVHSVMSVVSGGLVWLWLAKVNHQPSWLFPHTVALACHLAIIGAARLRFDFPQMPTWWLLTSCTGKSWAMMMIPCWLLTGADGWMIHLMAAVPIGLAVTAFYFTQPDIHDCPTDTRRWIWQAIVAGTGSVLGYGLMNIPWPP